MLKYMTFDVEIATKYGTNVSILLGNINYWIQKNKENGKHLHDGRYWTYNTVAAFHSLMPFMSENVINTALAKAEAEGLLVTGNYNKLPFDRTKWYALTEKGERLFQAPQNASTDSPSGSESISQNREVDSTELGNSISQKSEMEIAKIQNDISENRGTNTKVIQMNNSEENQKHIVRKGASAQRQAPSRPWDEEEGAKVAEVVQALNDETGSHYRPTSKATMRHVLARLREGFTVEECKEVIRKKSVEWGGTEMAKYLRPETLFGSKFEGYLNAPEDPKARERAEKAKAEAEARKRLHEKYAKWDDEIEEW
jgi:uncharacterized phage protein (TIGR02220 family)